MVRTGQSSVAALAMAMLLPLLLTPALSADDLDAIRDSVNGRKVPQDPDDKDHRKEKRGHRRRRRDDCDDDRGYVSIILEDVFGPPVFWTLAFPWWGPAAMVGDDYTTYAEFPHFPYAVEPDRYLNFDFDGEPMFKSYGGRFSAEYATDFSGVQRAGGRLQFETASRFGFDTEWNHWVEDVRGGRDSLWTGDANLTFRFAQSESAQFYTGLGVNWLGGDDRDAGINFTYGFDWFPVRPLVVRSVLDAGTLGDTGLIHNKTTIGIVHKHVEMFTGFDVLRIGGTNLQGVIAGFTIWY